MSRRAAGAGNGKVAQVLQKCQVRENLLAAREFSSVQRWGGGGQID